MSLVVNNEVKIPLGKIQMNLDKVIGMMVYTEADHLTRFIGSQLEIIRRNQEYINKFSVLYQQQITNILNGEIQSGNIDNRPVAFVLFRCYEGLWNILPPGFRDQVERKGFTCSDEIFWTKHHANSILMSKFPFGTLIREWKIEA